MFTPDDLMGPAAPVRLTQAPQYSQSLLPVLPCAVTKAGPLCAAVLTSGAQLATIRLAWNSLYHRALAPRATLSFEWVTTAWRHIAEPSGARLCVVVVHNTERRLLALWPIVVHVHHRLWRRARQLCASWDYNDILIDSNESPYPLVDLAWQALTRASRADLIALSLVPAASPLHHLLTTKAAKVTDQTSIDTINWDGIANWQNYYRKISDRPGWDRRERRLREQGEVTFGIATSPDEAVRAIQWVLTQKRLWLDRKGKSSDWLHEPGYENFLLASVKSMRDAARIVVFTLTLDCQLIAVQVSLVDEHRMFCHHTAFDPAFAKFSPGILVLKFTLSWAFERRLLLDLGYGHEANKTALANSSYDVADFLVVNSAWGHWHQALKRYRSPSVSRDALPS